MLPVYDELARTLIPRPRQDVGLRRNEADKEIDVCLGKRVDAVSMVDTDIDVIHSDDVGAKTCQQLCINLTLSDVLERISVGGDVNA